MTAGPFLGEFVCTFCGCSAALGPANPATHPCVCEACCEENADGHEYTYDGRWECQHCGVEPPRDFFDDMGDY